ncbi:MAG: hypothetical protein WA813_19785, partial [Beijerinckiaceae bacterium]
MDAKAQASRIGEARRARPQPGLPCRNDRPSFVLAKNRRFVGHVFSSGADRYSMKESREAGVQFPLTIPDEGEILRASGLVICR